MDIIETGKDRFVSYCPRYTEVVLVVVEAYVISLYSRYGAIFVFLNTH